MNTQAKVLFYLSNVVIGGLMLWNTWGWLTMDPWGY
jgi:hypothetical protein